MEERSHKDKKVQFNLSLETKYLIFQDKKSTLRIKIFRFFTKKEIKIQLNLTHMSAIFKIKKAR